MTYISDSQVAKLPNLLFLFNILQNVNFCVTSDTNFFLNVTHTLPNS